jgi:hypothetical protein
MSCFVLKKKKSISLDFYLGYKKIREIKKITIKLAMFTVAVLKRSRVVDLSVVFKPDSCSMVSVNTLD